MSRVLLAASLAITTSPFIPPVARGDSDTLKLTLCPGVSVSGKFNVPKLNPVPVSVACDTVTLVPPELVNDSERVRVVPVTTFPNPRLAGLAVSCPGETPAPVRAMLSWGFEASLVSARLPLAVPVDCGRKLTLNVVLWPAARFIGRFRFWMLKPLPVTAACDSVMVVEPEFVTDSVRV
jgi:hypothetical protein